MAKQKVLHDIGDVVSVYDWDINVPPDKIDEFVEHVKQFAKERKKETENLSDDARQKRAEYLREWKKKNKNKVKEYNRTYWERKAQQSK